MIHRPLAVWVLSFVVLLAGLVSLVIMLQFLEIVPDTGEPVQFFGGKWVGVVLYGVEAGVLIAAAVGWLLLKPWAFIFTLLFALFGFFVPLMSYFAGTSLFSAAAAPMILSAVIVLLSTRPPVRRALAEAAAQQNEHKPVATPPSKAAAAAPRTRGLRSEEV